VEENEVEGQVIALDAEEVRGMLFPLGPKKTKEQRGKWKAPINLAGLFPIVALLHIDCEGSECGFPSNYPALSFPGILSSYSSLGRKGRVRNILPSVPSAESGKEPLECESQCEKK